MNNLLQEDTICALATGGGLSAIAIIRLSGKDAIKITNSIFSKDISDVKTHTIHFGTITENNKSIVISTYQFDFKVFRSCILIDGV